MSGGWNLLNFFSPNNQTGAMGTQTPSTPLVGIDGAAQFVAPQRLRDVVGKLKVSQSQNIYDADFEYGVQPLRWENYINNVSGQASIVQNPGLGGVSMTIGGGNVPGDITIRQSRPYHRYQPGKTMYMASNVNFGTSLNGQFQRVGIFDDSNGIFFMQSGTPTPSNPYAMSVVLRSDSGGLPTDTVFPADQWNGNQAIIKSLDWTKVQMIWMEYAWYGAGALRWGVVINGEPWVVHQVGTGNATINGTAQVKPWSRTGNLPARYEQRDTGSTGLSVMTHYGVSILIEGGIDKQRGFTYSYGNYAGLQVRTAAANSIRFPVMSFRMRSMGADQFDNTQATITAGTVSSLSINANTPAITTIAGQSINSQSLVTFTSAHGYPITNPAQANNPAQYITLASFTQLGTATGYSISSGSTSLLVSTSTGTFYPSATLSGTGITSGTTITQQQSAFGTVSATVTYSSGGAVGTNTITFTTNANGNGAPITGTNIPAGTIIISGGGTTSVTLSNNFTSQAAGTYTFYNYTATGGYSSGGAIGSSTVTLSSVSSFLVGQMISGPGLPTGTFISAINGNTLTLTASFTSQASGQYTVQAPGGNGIYSISQAAGTVTGNISSVYNVNAGTYLISSVPNTTQIVLNIPLINTTTASTLPAATYWGTNQYVGKFLYYNATVGTLSAATVGSGTLIGGVTQFPTNIVFGAAHGLVTGDVINIASSSPVTYNGQFNFTSTSATGGTIYFGSSNPGSYTNSAVVTTPVTARVTSNTTNVLTFNDIVTGLPCRFAPALGNKYQIGLIDRGQLLPQTLLVNTSATALIELIASTPTNQTSLCQANFVPLNTLGSFNSFAEVDLASANVTGGEVVYSFSTPNNALQQLDLSNFFPVLNNIKGNVADILTVAITTAAANAVQINVVCQEAMA
jgi:hypothetical protein